MKVYVVYNNTLHLSAQNSNDNIGSYVSLCGKTDAHDIRDYARNGGAKIYSYQDVTNSRIGSPRFNTSICEACFNRHAHDNLNEVPPEFRNMFETHDVEEAELGSPSSVATDGGEIEQHIREQEQK